MWPWSSPVAATSATEAAVSTPPSRPGLLRTLFDATFSHLLGLRLIRLLYLVALLSIGTYGFIAMFLGISQGGMAAVLSVFVVPFLALLAIALVRAVFEVLVTIFRIGEQTERMAMRLHTLSTRLGAPDRTDGARE
jgi:hypothetical protein